VASDSDGSVLFAAAHNDRLYLAGPPRAPVRLSSRRSGSRQGTVSVSGSGRNHRSGASRWIGSQRFHRRIGRGNSRRCHSRWAGERVNLNLGAVEIPAVRVSGQVCAGVGPGCPHDRSDQRIRPGGGDIVGSGAVTVGAVHLEGGGLQGHPAWTRPIRHLPHTTSNGRGLRNTARHWR
jgi:hypothetical protein